jgi:hypothetical protein
MESNMCILKQINKIQITNNAPNPGGELKLTKAEKQFR